MKIQFFALGTGYQIGFFSVPKTFTWT